MQEGTRQPVRGRGRQDWTSQLMESSRRGHWSVLSRLALPRYSQSALLQDWFLFRFNFQLEEIMINSEGENGKQ